MKRLNAKGCLAALISGFALGAFRLAVDTPVALGLGGYEGGYAPGSFLWIVNNIYFQYYSLIIFVTAVAVMVGVSYATREPTYEHISGLTYATVTDEHRARSRGSWDYRDVVGSAIVLVMITLAYLYFRG
jgi:SSS family solute:Na+ symporter